MDMSEKLDNLDTSEDVENENGGENSSFLSLIDSLGEILKKNSNAESVNENQDLSSILQTIDDVFNGSNVLNKDFSSVSEEPVEESKNLGTETEEPDEVSKNLGAETQEPDEVSVNLGTEAQGPVEESENLGAEAQEPDEVSEDLVAEAQGPVEELENLGAETQKPVEESENLGAETQKPVEESEDLDNEFGASLVVFKDFDDETVEPVAENGRPVTSTGRTPANMGSTPTNAGHTPVSARRVYTPNRRIVRTRGKNITWVKAVAGLSGVVLGIGLSCVPGVGTIRMGLATAKLVRFAADKVTGGKITDFIDTKERNFKNKHPKIGSVVENVRKVIKNDKFQWFLNGVSIGYITGNVIELATGKTLIDHLVSDNAKSVASANAYTPRTGTTTIIPEEAQEPAKEAVKNVVKPGAVKDATKGVVKPGITNGANTAAMVKNDIVSNFLTEGQTYDLSSIARGYVSSYSDSSVHLLQDVGKNVIFDKINNGYAHFIQPNGAGYAWIKLEDLSKIGLKPEEIIKRAVR